MAEERNGGTIESSGAGLWVLYELQFDSPRTQSRTALNSIFDLIVINMSK